MAITDPQDTLAYHQSRVFTSHRDMSDVPLSAVTAKVKDFLANDPKKATTQPENEALWFYGMNNGMALISAERAPLEPLSKDELDFVNAYHAVLGPKAIRAFYYLLMICTREARHNKSLTSSVPQMKTLFGNEAAMFFKMSGGEGDIHKKLMNTPPHTTLGKFVECIRWQFYNSTWSSGYGGKKWGMVTDCLCRFVRGEYSAEMMMDTIWTLCHNGGPIFNKPNLGYAHWDHTLNRILDVQRAGQVPEALLYDSKVGKFGNSELFARMKWLKKRFASKLRGYVDWQVIELWGVHKYPNDIAAQHKAHGMSPEAKAAQEAAQLKALAEQELAEQQALAAVAAAAQQAAEHAKNWFQVMPGVEVKKFERA